MTDVKISAKRLKELERAESKLNALEAGGVDNWDYYGESLRDWFKETELEEIIESFIENAAQILAEDSEVDYPAGREAGPNVQLTSAGENALRNMLNIFIKEYKELMEDE